MYDMNLKKIDEASSNTIFKPASKRWFHRIVFEPFFWLAITIGVILNILAFLPFESFSKMSLALWYADIRYWPGWIASCCQLVLAWAFVAMLIALFVPKNTEHTFLLQRSFYKKIVSLIFVLLIGIVWFYGSKTRLLELFSPLTKLVEKMVYEYLTMPLADYYTTGEGRPPLFWPIVSVILFAILFIAWRFWHHLRRWHRSKAIIAPLLFVAALPISLNADEPIPPKKVETSIGIYDVKSKDDLLDFTSEDIRKLVKMEDDRTRGAGKTPHPILVYCFEERAFQYTGGKYDNAEIKYRLHVPKKLIPGKKYPLVIHLHGVGESGKDNTFSLAHLHSILPLMVGPEQQDFYLLVLQCPPDNRVWTFKSDKDGNLDVVVAATDHVIQNNPIDKTRLSVFGLSSGGTGVWQWIINEPEKFAAAVPVSCGASIEYPKLVALTQTSIWTFRNKGDNSAPVESIRKAMQTVNGSNGYMKLTQFDQGGHAAWRPAMDEYNCFSWMIAQKRDGWLNPFRSATSES